MRIKELADLTGTTVRTVRYYHQLALLPVPAARNGHRDYDLVHVARLARIRWLARAGVPLSRIAAILSEPAGPRSGPADTTREGILVDLRDTLLGLDEQIERLRAQRERVTRLVASVERDDHLSPMPRAMARFYDELERRAGDDKVRRAVVRERDFLELAFYRGDMPPEAEAFYRGIDDAGLSESLAAFAEAVARADTGAPPTDDETAEMAAAQVARLRRQIGPDLPRVLGSIDRAAARRAAALYLQITDERDRRRVRVIIDALLAMLGEEPHR